MQLQKIKYFVNEKSSILRFLPFFHILHNFDRSTRYFVFNTRTFLLNRLKILSFSD